LLTLVFLDFAKSGICCLCLQKLDFGVSEVNASEVGSLGRTREAMRRHNLSAVLRLVHEAGSIARSSLTTQTGLNRSTISDLVDELKELGLVTEAEATVREGIGRPSLVVTASNQVVAFAAHPEVDFLLVAAVTLDGQIVRQEKLIYQAPVSAHQTVRDIAKLTLKIKESLHPNATIAGLGVAVPGQVRLLDGVVREAPHLDWLEFPLVKELDEQLGMPIFIDNDASLAARAERIFGAAKKFDDIIYLFGGSGIGGGVFTGGVQLRGATGYGGELGHTKIADFTGLDYSGLIGTLESIVRREDLVAALKLGNADDNQLENALLSKRSDEVKQIVERQIDALAVAIANYVNIFNPQIIVLGGFLPALYWYDQERLLAGIAKGSLFASREGIIVRVAELGARTLLIGAAELPFTTLINDPATPIKNREVSA
jgi:predicted NBD/HSP70 family sugar kinase